MSEIINIIPSKFDNLPWGTGICALCGEKSNNVGRNLCNTHTDELRAERLAATKAWEAAKPPHVCGQNDDDVCKECCEHGDVDDGYCLDCGEAAHELMCMDDPREDR